MNHNVIYLISVVLGFFVVGGITFAAYDHIGGSRVTRRVLKEYLPLMDAIVFMIDASDRERFQESKDELADLLADESIANAPVLILGNKIDLRHCFRR